MKKFILIILCLITAVCGTGILTGCDDDNGKTVILLGMWPDSGLTDDVAMFNEWKAAFETDYPEYVIKPSPYAYDPSTITFDAVGGTLPTIFQTYFTEPEKLIANDWIRPITAQAEELGWIDKMDDDMRAALTRNGELYGIPRDGYGMGLFINMEMLYEAGWLEKYPQNHPLYPGKYRINADDGTPLYPTTFEQIKAASRDVVNNSPSGTYGIVVLSANKNGGWQFCNMAWNFGLDSFQYKDGGSWKSRLNAPQSVSALNWIKGMKSEELISPEASLTYTDWYVKIYQKKAAMAFAGSDAIANPVNNSSGKDKFNKDNIAFVPMPHAEGATAKALFGGTPFVFAANATDKQVEGALKFLEYMGRSPETSDIARKAMRDGNNVAQRKNMPILPTIKPWKNSDYLEMAQGFEAEFINVEMIYYKDFFESINAMKKAEEANYCQEMYACLDNAIQAVLSDKSGTPQSFLDTANSTFYNQYLSKI